MGFSGDFGPRRRAAGTRRHMAKQGLTSIDGGTLRRDTAAAAPATFE